VPTATSGQSGLDRPCLQRPIEVERRSAGRVPSPQRASPQPLSCGDGEEDLCAMRDDDEVIRATKRQAHRQTSMMRVDDNAQPGISGHVRPILEIAKQRGAVGCNREGSIARRRAPRAESRSAGKQKSGLRQRRHGPSRLASGNSRFTRRGRVGVQTDPGRCEDQVSHISQEGAGGMLLNRRRQLRALP